MKIFVKVLFRDLPWVLDRAMRHTEFWVNARYWLVLENNKYVWKRRLPFLMPFMLSVVLIFSLYGPTFDSLCAVFPGPIFNKVALLILELFLSYLVGKSWWEMWTRGDQLISRRRKKLQELENSSTHSELYIRVRFMRIFLNLLIIIVLAPLLGAIVAIYQTIVDDANCRQTSLHWLSVVQLLSAILLTAIAFHAVRKFRFIPVIPTKLLWTPFCFVLTLLAFWLNISLFGIDNHEADYRPYFTSYSVLAMLLFGVACVLSYLLPPWVLFGVAEKPIYKKKVLLGLTKTTDAMVTFKEALTIALSRCELFVATSEPELESVRMLYALSAPLASPLLLLLIPAIYILIADRSLLIGWIELTIFICWWLIISMSNVSTRWNQQLLLFKRWFFTGLPLIVSLAVVLLAVCRFFSVEYVSYVIDAAPYGVVTLFAVMFYSLAWTVEGCLHRPLQMELLALLAPPEDVEAILEPRKWYIKYLIDQHQFRDDKEIRVAIKGRRLLPHGSSRFAVVGRLIHDKNRPAFHVYSDYDLFSRLVENEQKFLSPYQYKQLEGHLHDLRRRLQNYFVIINLIVAGTLITFMGCVWQADHNLGREPIAKVDINSQQFQAFDLSQHLQKQSEVGQPAILIAASGGGTRAALYSTAALQGLTKSGYGRDILLTSGVSGGGVSLAYFAAHYKALLNLQNNEDSWLKFIEAMSFNHIQDVLQGIGEWRLIRKQSLAQLLVESFDRQFKKTDGSVRYIGEIHEVGLILNTTITAHPFADSTLLTHLFKNVYCAQTDNKVFTKLEGGRLIFTNLSKSIDFSRHDNLDNELAINPDIDLSYKVIRQPNVPITAAAALNANFPPVFANSGIWELNDEKFIGKYYVTDGGINENRGLISLLYALEQALQGEHLLNKSLDIHVLALDASAFSIDYDEDRGIHNMFAGTAQERLSSGLERQLLTTICARAKALGGECAAENKRGNIMGPRIHMHYLKMPALLAMRGGFGTHWMLPDEVSLTDPHDPEANSWLHASAHKELNNSETQTFIQCLFTHTSKPGAECQRIEKYLSNAWLIDTEACSNENSAGHCVAGWRDLLLQLANETNK